MAAPSTHIAGASAAGADANPRAHCMSARTGDSAALPGTRDTRIEWEAYECD